MKSSRLIFLAAITLLINLCAANVPAQFETATVLGTVRDPNGSVVSGATVTLKNLATGISANVTTDTKGDYQFVNTKIGNYQIIAEANGFTRVIAEDVEVTVNARQRVDLTLQIAAAVATVTITDAANLLEADSSERGQVVQRQQIVSLPLNGRSYANLTLLAPGVRESSFNGIGSPGREASFNVNGLRSTVNNFLLDGIDNNAYGTSNQSFSNQVVQVSPDAVAQFKVETNTYSAEYGRSGGAVVNASYRSGTNQFHGSAWEFHRNTVLNAVGFFKPNLGVKPPLLRNQFGFTFGGPIIKDRTFFFGDYEGFRQIQKNLVFSNLPTLAQRNGILTVAVRNPFTGDVIPAGTQIPLTAFAQKVLNQLPAPNLVGVPGNNYQELVLNRNFNDKFNIRIDHRFNNKLSIFGRYSNRTSHGFEAPNIPGASGSNQNGFVDILNRQLILSGNYTFENSSMIDLRFAYSRIDAGKKPPLTGGPSMQQLYGISGLPDDPMVTGGLTTQTITGFSQLGRQATNPQFQNPRDVDMRLSYAFTRGRHSLKTGYEYLAVNTDVQDTNPLMGLDTYSGQFSRPTGAASNNLYNLADFYFGARSQYELANLLVVNLRQRLHFGYLQDDLKVNRKLTLNLGLRYEFSTPLYEEHNRLSNYDPVTNTIIQASNGSLYNRGLVDPDHNNFGPRLGFAYEAFPRTVVRGGFGMGYIYFNRLGSANLLATNFPQITRAAIAQATPSTANPLCTGNNFAGCFRATQQGYPSGLPNNVTLYIPRNTPTSYVQNWQLSVQREIFANTVIDIAYVGNRARNLVLIADFNQARPLTDAEAALPAAQQPSLQARRPIPGFATISAVLPEAFSDYQALQVKFERRFSRGLYLLNSFTYSKATDDVTQVLEEPNGNTGQPQDIHNIGADEGRSAFDQPLNNTTSFVWDVPLGRGRKFGGDMNHWLDSVIGGWTLSGINTMASGQTINFRYGPSPVTNNLATFLGGVALRPNLLCDPTNHDVRPNPIAGYFNAACLQRPPVTAPFGNAGRNIARSNAFYQFDLGVQKQFHLPITEATRLEFRAEFFNLFNKTNFQAATSDITSSAFGTITSTFPARQIQFAVKLDF
jgi:hypothetical protein